MFFRDFDEILATILLRLKKIMVKTQKCIEILDYSFRNYFNPLCKIRQSEGEDNLLGSYVYLVNTLSIIFSFLAWEVSYRI